MNDVNFSYNLLSAVKEKKRIFILVEELNGLKKGKLFLKETQKAKSKDGRLCRSKFKFDLKCL